MEADFARPRQAKGSKGMRYREEDDGFEENTPHGVLWGDRPDHERPDRNSGPAFHA
ncbi:hypothetical protein [Streptomyces sp. NPDC093992]|uniref:hypothetical protein n=1 Tax=Streptomyces sp. NPDC093992 TaxID=3366053 RepID=UPI0038357CFE